MIRGVLVYLLVYYLLVIVITSLVPPLPFALTAILNALVFSISLHLNAGHAGVGVVLSSLLFSSHFQVPLSFTLINQLTIFSMTIPLKRALSGGLNPYFLLFTLLTFLVAELTPWLLVLLPGETVKAFPGSLRYIPFQVLASFIFSFPIPLLFRSLLKWIGP